MEYKNNTLYLSLIIEFYLKIIFINTNIDNIILSFVYTIIFTY